MKQIKRLEILLDNILVSEVIECESSDISIVPVCSWPDLVVFVYFCVRACTCELVSVLRYLTTSNISKHRLHQVVTGRIDLFLCTCGMTCLPDFAMIIGQKY